MDQRTTRDPGRATQLTPLVVRAWVRGSLELLTAARSVIDSANVFPVADRDTGTNMSHTLAQGSRTVEELPSDAPVPAVLQAWARGALLGARGNSGVILSEYLRGFAEDLAGSTATRREGRAVAEALDAAARRAYDAVGQPRQGTILSAADGAAVAALAATADGALLDDVLTSATAGARAALGRSVDDLDVLRDAGVLDAGAYGLVLVLDALVSAVRAPCPDGGPASVGHAVSGGPGSIAVMETLQVGPPRPSGEPSAGPDGGRPTGSTVGAGGDHAGHSTVDGEFEVMLVVEDRAPEGPPTTAGASPPDSRCATTDDVVDRLRCELQEVGDSVVVVGGGGAWQVHVHTDDPNAVLRITRRWVQRQIVVRSLSQQVAQRAAGDRATTGVVACTASPGLVADLARAGAVVVLRGSVAVSADDLVRAATETGAQHVVLLPGDAPTLRVAGSLALSAAASAEGREDAFPPGTAPGHDGLGRLGALHVAPTTSDLHVVAAMSSWAALASTDDIPSAFAALDDAARSVRAARVATADGAAVRACLDTLLTEAAHDDDVVLTVLAGDLVPARVVTDVTAHAQAVRPGIDVVVLPSGQRSASLVLGID